MRERMLMTVVAGIALSAGAWAGALMVDSGPSTRTAITRTLVDTYDVNQARRTGAPSTITPEEGALSDAISDAGYRWARYMEFNDPKDCLMQPPGAFRDGCAQGAAEHADPE